MVRWLMQAFNKHPIAGPIISAGIRTSHNAFLYLGALSVVGDVLAQQWMEGKSLRRHNWRRTVNLAIYGLFIIVPRLLTLLTSYFPAPHQCYFVGWLTVILAGTAQRVLLDQAVFTPIFLAVYFIYHGICEGASRMVLEHKFRNSYLTALIANYKVWPAVQCVNFYFIPLNLRLLFVNLVAIGWTAYLSNLNALHAHQLHRKL